MNFEIVRARGVNVDTHGVNSRCEGDAVGCPFNTFIAAEYPKGCRRCRQIKNDVLALDWFLRNCSREEISLMFTIPHVDWTKDIHAFDQKVARFLEDFLANTAEEELQEFSPNFQQFKGPKLKKLFGTTVSDLRGILVSSVLSQVQTTLKDEFGAGQRHRRSMAYILDALIVIPSH